MNLKRRSPVAFRPCARLNGSDDLLACAQTQNPIYGRTPAALRAGTNSHRARCRLRQPLESQGNPKRRLVSLAEMQFLWRSAHKIMTARFALD